MFQKRMTVTITTLVIIMFSVSSLILASCNNSFPESNITTSQTIEAQTQVNSTATATITVTPTSTRTITPTVTLEPTPTATRIPFSDDITMRGYYHPAGHYDIQLFYATIDDWQIKNQKVYLEVRFVLYGKEFQEELHTPYTGFGVAIYDNRQLIDQQELFIEKDLQKIEEYLSRVVDENLAVGIWVYSRDVDEITDQIILDYVNEEIDLNFIFGEIIESKGYFYDK